jgi:hypothetical protein
VGGRTETFGRETKDEEGKRLLLFRMKGKPVRAE